jgi:hypothetical protein
MVLLQNTQSRIFNIGLQDKYGTITLLPGINEIDRERYDMFEHHPMFQARVRDGIIKILDDVRIGPDGKKSINDMLKLMPKIYDTKLLKKIIREDGRDTVINAAKDQLEAVSPSKKDSEAEAKNEHFK